MAGLPRSGSTMLSAILNQNPEIYSSPQTDLVEILFRIHEFYFQSESYQSGFNIDGYENVLKKIAENFYENINHQYIIDKNRAWGTPYNLNLAKILNEDVKIICPIRKIEDILNSFLHLIYKNPETNFVDKQLNASNYFWQWKDLDDARIDLLMQPGSQIEKAVQSLSSAIFDEHKNKFHFVWFDDLCKNPEKSLNDIYDFLKIEKFAHSFQNITTKEHFEDEKIFGIKELHEIRKTISLPNNKNILSNRSFTSYQNFIPENLMSLLLQYRHK